VDADEPAFLGMNKDDEDERESDLIMSKTKKKRKERDELLEKQLEIEEGKEKKKLENFLFGSLNSPVQFGIREEENNSLSFFLDRSVGGVGPDSQEDVELTEDIEEENKQRKLPGLTRKDGDESLISGTRYVARLRAQHAKMNPDTHWARLDSQSRNDACLMKKMAQCWLVVTRMTKLLMIFFELMKILW
jgi:U3 small nucleolar RNA-associated protein 18